jgi:hypothetical protein
MGVLRDILDLLVIREESKKRRVETRLAEKELANKTSLIVPATDEDVKRFDPKTAVLINVLDQAPRTRRRGMRLWDPLVWVVLFSLALVIVLKYCAR